MSPEIPISPPIRTACLRASVPDRISITSSSLPYSRRAGRMSGTAKAGLAGCTIGIIVGICMYASFLLFNMVSGGSTNLLERYYNQYMQEYQMTPDNGTTTDGNTI